MSRVFIIQNDTSKDFSKAKRFGETIVITHKGLFADNAVHRVDEFKERSLQIMMEDFDETSDYILLVGSPVYIIMLGAILGSLGLYFFKTLMYDREEEQYFEVEIKV